MMSIGTAVDRSEERTVTDHELDTERATIIETLARHRGFLAQTLDGVGDEDAARRTTVSELCLGGIVKHVASTTSRWLDFVEHGPGEGVQGDDPAAVAAYTSQFRMDPDDTVASVLANFAEAGRRTDELVRSLPSLDADQPLPSAPWFEPGARWSARRVFLHLLAETAQHAGHADIIRESLDGARTMG